MVNYKKILKPVNDVLKKHWKVLSILLGTSFLVATIVSVVVGRLVLSPENISKTMRPSTGTAQTIEINLPEGSVTLNEQAIEKILKRNIFNSEGPAVDPESQAKDEKGASVDNKPVKSDLPLKLLGTICVGDPSLGIALIENSEKSSINSFMVGDMLVEGAIVLEVHCDRIIITRNNHKEFVEIIKTELVRSKRDKKKSKKTSTSSDEPTPLATEPPPDTFKEDGFERSGDKIEMSGSYRERLLSTDFAKVLQDAKATPNLVGGELKGFVLDRIRKDSIYEKSGFQNGDIVEEINGISLNDTGQAIKLLNSLRGESELEVRYKRNGKSYSKTLNVK